MDMEFQGLNGGGLNSSWSVWVALLKAATANGWEKRGTRPCDLDFLHSADGYPRWPEEPPADGDGAGYMGNNFQLVDEEDAANLAGALERATHNGTLDEECYGMIKDTSSSSVREMAIELVSLARRGGFYLS